MFGFQLRPFTSHWMRRQRESTLFSLMLQGFATAAALHGCYFSTLTTSRCRSLEIKFSAKPLAKGSKVVRIEIVHLPCQLCSEIGPRSHPKVKSEVMVRTRSRLLRVYRRLVCCDYE
ncbi:hypothetical protein L218DRAFT_558944 [Marasmius fiardii PR-910]|nr:hypothetical protein L218DRAFT_558944 [Marasmius fiardii PR-910]